MTIMTADEAQRIVNALKPGQSFIYYRGHIARDRACCRLDLPINRIDALADLMIRHGCPPDYPLGPGSVVRGLGTGALTQRRVGPCDYEYRFTKTPAKGPARMSENHHLYVHGGRAYTSMEVVLATGAPLEDIEEYDVGRAVMPSLNTAFRVNAGNWPNERPAMMIDSEEVVRWADGRGPVSIEMIEVVS